jgi:hypothetical protein
VLFPDNIKPIIMTKLVKTLIIINGLLIPSVLLILFISFLIREFGHKNYQPDPVMTENLITNDGDTLMAQGLVYDLPESVYNSTNLYIKVGPKTYEIPKLKDSYSVNFEGGDYSRIEPYEYFVNILFLDSKYNLLSTLVDKKASIKTISIPAEYDSEKIDTTVKNIGYLISFEDSNKDKLIDWNDKYDLYISDLSGKGLTKVTNGIDVKSFEFINSHKEIFISFTERKDIPDEHKITRFALYDIKSRELKILTHLDKAINTIQTILNK